MTKLWVKTIGADKKHYEFVFDSTDYTKLTELMAEHGLSDYKIIDWRLKNITFIQK